jgi:hypothetical protein
MNNFNTQDRNGTHNGQVAPAEETPVAEAPTLSDEEIAQFTQAHQILQRNLDENDDLMPEIESIIREHLRKEIATTTLPAIYQALQLLIDEGAAEHLLVLLACPDDKRIIELTRSLSTAETWHWLRHLLAVYGAALQEGYTISGQNLNGWRQLNRRAYYDGVTDSWGVMLEIVKYNGDRLSLEETPYTALNLAWGIIDTVKSVPPDVAPYLLERPTIENFMKQCFMLSELYAPGLLDELSMATDEEAAEGENSSGPVE